MKYKYKKSLPGEGIFYNLNDAQVEALFSVLNKSVRGDKTNNIAWYYSGYVNYIKKQSALPTRIFEEYFQSIEEGVSSEQTYNNYLITN